jgi:ribosome-associated protein
MTTKTTPASAAKTAAKTPAKAAVKTPRSPRAAKAPEANEVQQSMLSREVGKRAQSRVAAPEATVSVSKASVGKRDVQKLQRAIVDGLEDVKAQEIGVFDTEHLTSLFERVIIASGTSNRQTKALAMSVVDAVRDAGFPKPRVEGETNGEWIIVDCGQAVVHVMQPNIRLYYNLEELWGDKPVRLKLGAAKPVVVKAVKPPAALTQAARQAKPESSLRRSSAAKKGVEEAFPSKAQLKKAQETQAAAAKKAAAKSAPSRARSAPAADAPAKPKLRTLVVNAPGKPAAAKKSAAKPAARSAPAKRAAKPAVRKP